MKHTIQTLTTLAILAFTLPAFANTYKGPFGMVDISIVNHSGQVATCSLQNTEGDHIEVQTPAAYVLAQDAKEHFKIAWVRYPSSHRYHSLGTVKCESTWYDNPNQGTGYHHQVASVDYHGKLTVHRTGLWNPVHEIVKDTLQTTPENTYGNILNDHVKDRAKDSLLHHIPYKSWEIHTELTS